MCFSFPLALMDLEDERERELTSQQVMTPQCGKPWNRGLYMYFGGSEEELLRLPKRDKERIKDEVLMY